MKNVTPLFLLLVASSAFGQWTTNLAQNTTVRAVQSGEAATPLVVNGIDGSTYACWFENGSGAYQLRMQRIDAQGNRLWPDSGLVVSAHPQNSAIFRYDLRCDRDGNAVVAFQDERTGALDIVAYKIGPDGSFLWGPDGVELPTPGSTGMAPTVAPLSNGNTAIAWITQSNPSAVAVQLVDPAGNRLLPVPIEISGASNMSIPNPIATDDGGFILQYGISAGGFGIPPWLLRAQRYDAAGAPVWPSPVQVSSNSVPFFFNPMPFADGHNGYYIAFNTGNPDNASFTDVFVQRIRSNGTSWSGDGTRADISSNIQKFTLGKGAALVNDDDGLMVPQQITDGGQNQSGLAVQRIDTAGVRQLGNLAVPVLPLSGQAIQPWDVSATNDGAVVAIATGAFGQVHLSAVRVALDGTPDWQPIQHGLCTANSNKDDVQLTAMVNGQMVAVWQDDRSQNGIYAQQIDSLDISTGLLERTTAAPVVRLETNPADVPVLLLPLELQNGARVEVFDLQGKSTYAAALPATPRAQLPLGRWEQGLYTIRVTGKNSSGTVKWMKQ